MREWRNLPPQSWQIDNNGFGPHNGHKPSARTYAPQTVDLGEKRGPLDVVLGLGELSQPAVIAGKDSVFGGWDVAWFRTSAWNHFGKTF